MPDTDIGPQRRIVTVTPNPAIDLSTDVERVEPDAKLRCGPVLREPGGGGLNVARVVARLGGTSTAVYVSGGVTGPVLDDLLDGVDGVDRRPVRVADDTRQNLSVTESGGRAAVPVHHVRGARRRRRRRALLDVVAAAVEGREGAGGGPGSAGDGREGAGDGREGAGDGRARAWVVLSGSLPPGLPAGFVGEVARLVADRGGRFVADTSGDALRAATQVTPYLLKPNVRELRSLAGLPDRGDADADIGDEGIEEIAVRVHREGAGEVLVLSLGSGGAFVVSPDHPDGLPVRSPTVPIRSKVGAGDSMVGALVLRLAQGAPVADAVRAGVAAGAAAVTTPGSELARREDVERLEERMRAAYA